MKTIYAVIVISLVVFFSISCSSLHYSIKRNQKYTKKLAVDLYNKNGNAFYLYSTYSTFSTVWSYNDETVELYRLQKGFVRQKQLYKEKGIKQYTKVCMDDIEKEICKQCVLELDGDYLGFVIESDGIMHNHCFSVDLDCLKKGKFQSNFLNTLFNDIIIYKMWDIDYQ